MSWGWRPWPLQSFIDTNLSIFSWDLSTSGQTEGFGGNCCCLANYRKSRGGAGIAWREGRLFSPNSCQVLDLCKVNFFSLIFSDLKKTFEQPPYSVNVEMNHQTELRCLPPQGIPPPQVYWLKNGAVLEPDSNIIISSEGHLIISEARFQDTANYTCVAENIANKRFSDSVLLKVVGKCTVHFLITARCPSFRIMYPF